MDDNARIVLKDNYCGPETSEPGTVSDEDLKYCIGIMAEMLPLQASEMSADTGTGIPIPGPNGYINKALDSDVYGGRKISYMNRFDRFEQLEQVSPRIGMGLSKLGLKLRGPEFKLYTAIDAGLTDEVIHGVLRLLLQHWIDEKKDGQNGS